MIAEILNGLVRANLAAGAAILLVLAIRKPVRRLFGARIAYGLWLGAPLAAAAVFIPRPAIVRHVIIAPRAADLVSTISITTAPHATPFDIAPVLLALWLAGSAFAILMVLLAHRRGLASFGALSASPEQPGQLRAAREGLGPALIGIVSPRLVLPADFERRFAPREQAMVLAHEQSHLASGDVAANAIITLLTCLNWFNPLIHLAAFQARIDQELACDATVIARFPGERRTYADALLKTQLVSAPLPLGCYWPGGSSNLLKERVEMLAQITPGRLRLAAGVALVTALALGVGLTAWSAEPQPVRIAAAALPPSTSVAQTVAASQTPSAQLPSSEQPASTQPAHICVTNAVDQKTCVSNQSDTQDQANSSSQIVTARPEYIRAGQMMLSGASAHDVAIEAMANGLGTNPTTVAADPLAALDPSTATFVQAPNGQVAVGMSSFNGGSWVMAPLPGTESYSGLSGLPLPPFPPPPTPGLSR